MSSVINDDLACMNNHNNVGDRAREKCSQQGRHIQVGGQNLQSKYVSSNACNECPAVSVHQVRTWFCKIII